MKSECVSILLVEDDKVDVMAVKLALRKVKVCNPVTVVSNGIDALEALRGENGRTPMAQPCLILLDLNLPRMGGIEFLEHMRGDPLLRRSIVFVMTTSAAEEDRMRAYDFNIAGYLLKHSLGEDFLDQICMLEHYWRVVEFPDLS